MIKSQVKSRFPLETLSTNDFRLIQSHLWEEPEKQWFLDHFQGASVLGRAKTFFKSRGKEEIGFNLFGRWVISSVKSGRDRPSAWVEIRAKPSRVKIFQLYFYSGHSASGLNHALCLDYFLTSCFLIEDVDLIQIYIWGEQQAKIEDEFPAECLYKIAIPSSEIEFSEPNTPVFTEKTFVRLSRADWQGNEKFDDMRDSLNYLSKRALGNPLLERQRRPRGIFSLFGGDTRRKQKS